MSLELEPAELYFKRPFNVEVSQTLRLRNTTNSPVAFKVKTTAPKQYCVRPNAADIEPHGERQVTVVLQPMKNDPPLDAKCKDKFLVQSVEMDPSTEVSWSNVEKSGRGSIKERKIRVHWLPADSNLSPGGPNGAGSDDGNQDDSMLTSSPIPPAYTPRAKGTDVDDAASSNIDTRSMQAESLPTETDIQDSPAPATARSSSRFDSIQPEDTGKPGDDVLRRRKDEPSEESTMSSLAGIAKHPQQAAQASGVPIHIVALLCLFFFLLAYLFF